MKYKKAIYLTKQYLTNFQAIWKKLFKIHQYTVFSLCVHKEIYFDLNGLILKKNKKIQIQYRLNSVGFFSSPDTFKFQYLPALVEKVLTYVLFMLFRRVGHKHRLWNLWQAKTPHKCWKMSTLSSTTEAESNCIQLPKTLQVIGTIFRNKKLGTAMFLGTE